MVDLHLGLIGDNIAHSSAPHLHRLAGEQNGLDVQYDRLVPAELGKDFPQIFADCKKAGFTGLNVTYPYKEIALREVEIEDPQVARIGAINTIVFSENGAKGFNTDYSGFIDAYRTVRDQTPCGTVAMAGAGGVGKAVAFALLTLGARDIRLFDCDIDKANALADDMRKAATSATTISVGSTIEQATDGAEGLINCSPLGMVGKPGTPIPRSLMRDAKWVFDAIYTPIETQFILDAHAERLQIISGYELFFYQGVNAWDFFSGLPLDHSRLRKSLLNSQTRSL